MMMELVNDVLDLQTKQQATADAFAEVDRFAHLSFGRKPNKAFALVSLTVLVRVKRCVGVKMLAMGPTAADV